MTDTTTPNAKLAVIEPTRRNWAAAMNRNMELLDAIIGAYFVVGSLQGVWENSTQYTMGDCIVDPVSSAVWQCQVSHISSSIPTTFAEDRATYSTYWTVFSSPARARGAWTVNTNYAINDFVVSDSQYAVCIETHTSGASFAADSSKWSILVDLSTAGSLVLPTLGGATDANKTVTTNAAGTAYIVRTVADTLTMLGATTIGKAIFAATNEAAGRTAINAQIAGSYQPLDSDLTAIANNGVGVYGLALLLMADVAALKASLGLGSAAYMTGPASAIVGVDDVQTLTNKGLTSPSIVTPVIGTSLQWPDGISQFRSTWERYAADAAPSGAAAVTFSGMSAAIKGIQIDYHLMPVTNAVDLRLRLSQAGIVDTGANYAASNWQLNSFGVGSGAGVTTTYFRLNNVLLKNSATLGGISGRVIIMNVQGTDFTKVRGECFNNDNTNNYYNTDFCYGQHLVAGPIDGFELSFTSGNIASGYVTCTVLRA